MDKKEAMLSVNNLTVHYIVKDGGAIEAVNDVSFDIKKGETLGLVGETGAGKTTIALSILRLLQSPPGKVMDGEVFFNGRNLLTLPDKDMQKIRGAEISMVFQDPMTALNPVDTVGDQIAEVIKLHKSVTKDEAYKLAGDMLEVVGIVRTRCKDYPHQFSGGMKQRVVIAMALACSPELLIADEPTTALDVTIQAQVLDMMNGLKQEMGTSVLLITHDLGVVAQMCDRVAVMYAGEIVEYGTREHIFRNTSHPYTQGLFDSLPNMAKGDRLKPINGLIVDPQNLPVGCKFADRCDHCVEQCKEKGIDLREVSPGHYSRCLRVKEA